MAKSYRFDSEDNFSYGKRGTPCDECGRDITSNGSLFNDDGFTLFVCRACELALNAPTHITPEATVTYFNDFAEDRASTHSRQLETAA